MSRKVSEKNLQKPCAVLIMATIIHDIHYIHYGLGLGLGLLYNPWIIKLMRLDWYTSDEDEKKLSFV